MDSMGINLEPRNKESIRNNSTEKAKVTAKDINHLRHSLNISESSMKYVQI